MISTFIACYAKSVTSVAVRKQNSSAKLDWHKQILILTQNLNPYGNLFPPIAGEIH